MAGEHEAGRAERGWRLIRRTLATMDGWKSTLVLAGLVVFSAALSLGAVLGAYRGVSGVLGREVAGRGGLQAVHAGFLQLQESLGRASGSSGVPLVTMREQVGQLSSSFGKMDLAAAGVPAGRVAALGESLRRLEEALSGGESEGSGRVLAAGRELVNEWLAVERAMADRSASDLRAAARASRLTFAFLALLWACTAAAGVLLLKTGLRRSADSLSKLEEGCERLWEGEGDHRLVIAGSDDLKPLMERFNGMAESLQTRRESDLREMRAREAAMKVVGRYLKELAAGRHGELSDSGDAAYRELARAAASAAAASEALKKRGREAEKQLRDWRLCLDQDLAALSDYLRRDFLTGSGAVPRLSEGSLLAGLATELDGLSLSMREVVGMVRQGAESLHMVSTEIAESSGEQEKEFHDEYRVIHETAASVNEVSVAAKQSSQMVEYVFRSAQEAMETAEAGHGMVQQVMDSMNVITGQVADIAQEILNLSEKSQEIGKIAQTISDISRQTNLLALNAAIEAAGAGEHGRGFAVVAKEIRELASRSNQATKEIEGLIEMIQHTTNAAVMATEQGSRKVDAGVSVVTTLRKSFEKIIDKFQEVVESAHQISTAAQEQTVGARQVAQSINEIDRMMKGSLDHLGRFRQVVAEYRSMTESLHDITEKVRRAR